MNYQLLTPDELSLLIAPESLYQFFGYEIETREAIRHLDANCYLLSVYFNGEPLYPSFQINPQTGFPFSIIQNLLECSPIDGSTTLAMLERYSDSLGMTYTQAISTQPENEHERVLAAYKQTL